MHRFFCRDLLPTRLADNAGGPVLSAKTAVLDADEAHHARRVLRLAPGDRIELFDGRGTLAEGTITGWQSGATVELISLRHVERSRPAITVASAVPKGPRAGEMVNQLSQLGADVFTPLITERSIVDPRDSKIDKFARAAIESAKQCGRLHLMDVTTATPLRDVLASPQDLRLIAAPAPETIAPADLPNRLQHAASVLILIGPEGGWTDEELNAAKTAGCEPWPLGPHIMRIETAATAAIAIARYFAGLNGFSIRTPATI